MKHFVKVLRWAKPEGNASARMHIVMPDAALRRKLAKYGRIRKLRSTWRGLTVYCLSVFGCFDVANLVHALDPAAAGAKVRIGILGRAAEALGVTKTGILLSHLSGVAAVAASMIAFLMV